MIGQDKLAEERKRRSIELEQAIKEYGNARNASWKPRASRDSPLPGKARLDKAMRRLEVAARKVIELGKDDAT